MKGSVDRGSEKLLRPRPGDSISRKNWTRDFPRGWEMVVQGAYYELTDIDGMGDADTYAAAVGEGRWRVGAASVRPGTYSTSCALCYRERLLRPRNDKCGDSTLVDL